MPSDDYTSTSRGSLKLKGSTPSGIKKKKKKDKSKLSVVAEGGAAADSALQKVLADEDTSTTEGHNDKKGERDEELDETQLRELETRDGDGKTASERQYEEMRRKRLHERLQKEGVKTHKQRVEELNKYLSGLSEHHDMPKIGPG